VCEVVVEVLFWGSVFLGLCLVQFGRAYERGVEHRTAPLLVTALLALLIERSLYDCLSVPLFYFDGSVSGLVGYHYIAAFGICMHILLCKGGNKSRFQSKNYGRFPQGWSLFRVSDVRYVKLLSKRGYSNLPGNPNPYINDHDL
jgi:hypothetical protein